MPGHRWRDKRLRRSAIGGLRYAVTRRYERRYSRPAWRRENGAVSLRREVITMTRSQIYRLAAEADVEVRTLRAFLRGGAARAATRRVIVDAAARLGLADFIPAEHRAHRAEEAAA